MSDFGECTLTRIGGEAGRDRVRIDKADAHIRISPDLLDAVVADGHPDVTLAGDVLRIAAVNRTVEYRLGELAIDQHGCLWRHADRVDGDVPS